MEDHRRGDKNSARFHIAQVYVQAGKRGAFLFHADDPFAKDRRPLSPDRFALDRLLQSSDRYVQQFLAQLRSELGT